jgi:hypothetical protein
MKFDGNGRLHDDDGKYMSNRDERIFKKGQDSIAGRVMRVLSFGLWDPFARMIGLNPVTRAEEMRYGELETEQARKRRKSS